MMVDGVSRGNVRDRRLPQGHGLGLRAGECGDEDLSGAGPRERKGAGASGGAGGVDVVEEEDIAAGDEGWVGRGEGATQVLAALAWIEAELAFGLLHAGEEVVSGAQAQGGMRPAESGQGVGGEQFSLVEAALTSLAAEERDGGDKGLSGGIEDGGEIGDGVGEELPERLRGLPHAFELQQTDEAAQLALIDAEGDGAGEGWWDTAAGGADGAGEVAAGDEAFAFEAQGFAAGGAEGGGGVGFGLRTKAAEAELADGQGGGAQKRRGTEAAVCGEEGGDEVVEDGAGCAEEAVGDRGGRVVLLRALGSALCV